MVFSKGPTAVGGPGGAAFVPEQFELCINSPVRFWLAGSLGRNTPPCVCLSLEMSPGVVGTFCWVFHVLPSSPASSHLGLPGLSDSSLWFCYDLIKAARSISNYSGCQVLIGQLSR